MCLFFKGGLGIEGHCMHWVREVDLIQIRVGQYFYHFVASELFFISHSRASYPNYNPNYNPNVDSALQTLTLTLLTDSSNPTPTLFYNPTPTLFYNPTPTLFYNPTPTLLIATSLPQPYFIRSISLTQCMQVPSMPQPFWLTSLRK